MNELPPQGTEVVIAAIARNIEKSIVKDFNRISSAFSHFKQHWIVIESDSTDNSVRELKKLQEIYSNFTFTTLGKLETKYPRRMERLAVARNQYLKILENSQYSNVDYLVVADLNNLNNLNNLDDLLCGAWFAVMDRRLDHWLARTRAVG